jgi:hypothetical protein
MGQRHIALESRLPPPEAAEWEREEGGFGIIA